MSIAQVQRWVISALIASVTMFPLGALTAAIHVRAGDDRGGAVVLTVMMAAIGVAATAAVRLVHGRPTWRWARSPPWARLAGPAAGDRLSTCRPNRDETRCPWFDEA
jgi:hypothetical protein